MGVVTVKDLEKYSPLFRGKVGNTFVKSLMRFTGVEKINRLHQWIEDNDIEYGPDAAKGILDRAGIDYLVGNAQLLEHLPEGPFITISNHAYGHVDGITLVDMIGHIRPGAKVMVNKLLMYIRCLAPSFISVDPTGSNRKAATAESINGVRSALQTVRSGDPLCLFPSGAVSDLKIKEGWIIRDRDWQDAAIKLIMKAKVPVIPIRFFDRNSNFYYSLGLIDYRVRLLRLCHELTNKKGKSVRIGIGDIISVEEQNKYTDLQEFKAFLRSKVYEMPLPELFTPRSELIL